MQTKTSKEQLTGVALSFVIQVFKKTHILNLIKAKKRRLKILSCRQTYMNFQPFTFLRLVTR
jgi:hypothetical protein